MRVISNKGTFGYVNFLKGGKGMGSTMMKQNTAPLLTPLESQEIKINNFLKLTFYATAKLSLLPIWAIFVKLSIAHVFSSSEPAAQQSFKIVTLYPRSCASRAAL